MKKKVTKNNNGVIICDSMVMSVNKKRPDIRKFESIAIAVMGFVSVIMSFLEMFSLNYNEKQFLLTAVLFSVFYIAIALIGKRALWVMLVSILAFAGMAFKKIDTIADGFKFIYNVIYSDTYHTEIKYYKNLDPLVENESITVFFIFCLWLLAMIIYFFTIYHPSPILPLLATFPIVETGLYNGIEIPIFWGVMTIAYWLALLSMSTIDIGEINGGSSGFVRKDNTFFPKRQMKLKVTEKCGIFVIATIIIITAVSSLIISFSNYERSDELNRKRTAIRDAMNDFSFENLAESVSRITSAFGFEFKYENHKLGTNDRLKFKNTIDLIATFDQPQTNAVYLKDYTGSVYNNNEWSDLADDKYKNQLFSDFERFKVYPQDFASLFSRNVIPDVPTGTIWIKSKLRHNKSLAPYGTDNFGNLTYDTDKTVSSKHKNESEFSYKFISANNDSIASFLGDPMQNIYSASYITNEDIKQRLIEYCNENGLFAYDDVFYTENEMPFDNDSYSYSNGNVLIAQLFQERYKDFVYENYLTVPDNENMQEVREAYSDILSRDTTYATDKLDVLKAIRQRMDEQNTYTLSPGKTPSNRDFVNYFLLENHKGYCIHYATSGVILARMAGIPARYATGYVIVNDDFNNTNLNPDGSYTITVKDNRSHAWAEVYLDGYGWVPFEFTAGYSDTSTPPVTTTQTNSTETSTETTTSVSGERPITSNRQSTQKNTTVYQTTVTSVISTVTSHNITTKASFPKPLKNIITSVLTLGIIVLIVLARRKIILDLRTKKFTSGDNSSKTAYIYDYAEKLLATQKLKQENLTFKEFAEKTEKISGNKIFSSGDFSKFMNISLGASFSNIPPTDDEVKFCIDFVNNMSGKIYEQSNFIYKFIMKFITVLIK